jgi:hypothetical protein
MARRSYGPSGFPSPSSADETELASPSRRKRMQLRYVAVTLTAGPAVQVG